MPPEARRRRVCAHGWDLTRVICPRGCQRPCWVCDGGGVISLRSFGAVQCGHCNGIGTTTPPNAPLDDRAYLDFILATINAIGDISKDEACAAIIREDQLRRNDPCQSRKIRSRPF